MLPNIDYPLGRRTHVSIDSWATLKALLKADKARGCELPTNWYTKRYPISKELLVHVWRYYI